MSERDESPAETTWAGNSPLDTRWWWSPALWIVVGLGVIGYQVSAYAGDGGMWLNGVMIVIGTGVVLAGLVSLRRELAAHRARQAVAPPPDDVLPG